MKKLVLLLSAFALIGCGEKKAAGDNGATGNEQDARDSVATKSGATPASPESRLIGYWTIDEEKSLKALESLPESPDSGEEQEFRENIGQVAKRTVLNFFKGGKVVNYEFDDPPEDMTYTIVSEDIEAISVKIEDFPFTLILRGDTLQAVPPEGAPSIMKCILLSRIDAEEAKRHIKEAQSTNSEEVTEPTVPTGEDE